MSLAVVGTITLTARKGIAVSIGERYAVREWQGDGFFHFMALVVQNQGNIASYNAGLAMFLEW